MNALLPEFELYAIRYATGGAQRRDDFIGGDPHDVPMPMDYFVWAAVLDGRVIAVDTGFTEEVARQRKRDYLRCPVETLDLLGHSPEAVTDLILAHLNYDHAGNFDRYPNARFHPAGARAAIRDRPV